MGGEVKGRKKNVSENNCLLYDLDNISSEAEVVIHGFANQGRVSPEQPIFHRQ